jgi:hypothetical protein
MMTTTITSMRENPLLAPLCERAARDTGITTRAG